jgi:hypothetical protein
MDDLEFIKKHVPVNEGEVFDDCSHMLRSLLQEVAEAHIEAEFEDPNSDITEILHDLVIKYSQARVR